MGLILNIETSSEICSVALAADGVISELHENSEGQSHARVLTSLITQCMDSSGRSLHDLDAISVSKGPGSFTGLRIGVATAKGLCYALNKPIISVNTLQSMAETFIKAHGDYNNQLLCPMIDARRMEVYTAIFNADLTFRLNTSAIIVSETSFSDFTQSDPVFFFGNGASKCMHLLEKQSKAVVFTDFIPSASGMVTFSENSYNQRKFEDLAYFEPFYLKDFYTPGQPFSGT